MTKFNYLEKIKHGIKKINPIPQQGSDEEEFRAILSLLGNEMRYGLLKITTPDIILNKEVKKNIARYRKNASDQEGKVALQNALDILNLCDTCITEFEEVVSPLVNIDNYGNQALLSVFHCVSQKAVNMKKNMNGLIGAKKNICDDENLKKWEQKTEVLCDMVKETCDYYYSALKDVGNLEVFSKNFIMCISLGKDLDKVYEDFVKKEKRFAMLYKIFQKCSFILSPDFLSECEEHRAFLFNATKKIKDVSENFSRLVFATKIIEEDNNGTITVNRRLIKPNFDESVFTANMTKIQEILIEINNKKEKCKIPGLIKAYANIGYRLNQVSYHLAIKFSDFLNVNDKSSLKTIEQG